MENKGDTLVTVCCVCYNQERYIGRTLEGMAGQSVSFPYKVFVSDDGSTDRTPEIIRSYRNRFPDVIEDKSPSQHMGMWENILRLFGQCDTPYIAYCEGDDYWTDPRKLQKQVTYMERHPEVGFCYTDYSVCDNDGNVIQSDCFRSGLNTRPQGFREHLLNAGYIAPMTWMWRRDIHRLFMNSGLTGASDATFVWALECFRNTEVGFLPDNTAVYRFHWGTASRPSSVMSKLRYQKGVFDTQLAYAGKYCPDLLRRVQFTGYLELLPLAIKAEDVELEKEAERFFNGLGVDFRSVRNLCDRVNEAEADAKKARESKTYRLGRMLSRPFQIWRK